MLTADERMRIDAAAVGLVDAAHRDSLDEIHRDLRTERIRVLVLSTAMCKGESPAKLARMVREFPQVPTMALLSEFDQSTVRTVLSLGQCGIRTLIDVRDPRGWRELRTLLLTERASDTRRRALSRLSSDLAGCPLGAQRFFDVLFRTAARTTTVRALARMLEVTPGTLMSRFFRAQLPPPKRFLAFARLVCAAQLFENPGMSVSSVANQLNYSSPQSFGRHVRMLLGMSAVQFREQYDGDGMVDFFREELVLKHLTKWRVFDPYGPSARAVGIARAQRQRLSGTTTSAGYALQRVAEASRLQVAGKEGENLGGVDQ